MKLSFNIDYRTNWGESVYLCGDIEALGANDEAKAIKLDLDGVEHWSTVIEVEDSTLRSIISISYAMKTDTPSTNGALSTVLSVAVRQRHSRFLTAGRISPGINLLLPGIH